MADTPTLPEPQTGRAQAKLTSRVASLTAKVEAEDKAALSAEIAEEDKHVGETEYSAEAKPETGEAGSADVVDAKPKPAPTEGGAEPIQKADAGSQKESTGTDGEPKGAPAADADPRLAAFNKIKEGQLAISKRAKEIEAKEAELRAKEEELASKGAAVERFLKNKDNPAELLDWIEENVPKEKLIEFFTQAATPDDRQRVKIERQIQQEREERLKLERKLLEQDRRAQEKQAVAEVERQFVATLDQTKDKYPHVSKLPKDFMLRAAHAKAEEFHKIQQATGQEWGFHDILQSLEDETAQFAGLFKEAETKDQKTEKQSTPSRKTTRNLNDSLSSESSAGGEPPKLTRSERLRRITRRYEAS